MSQLDDVILRFREEIEGFISTDIVGVKDGISIAGGSIYHDFDSAVASAEFASVCQSSIRALTAIGDPTIEDILFTTANVYILIRVFQDWEFYHGLAISRVKGNLGRARLLMKNYEHKFLAAIPK